MKKKVAVNNIKSMINEVLSDRLESQLLKQKADALAIDTRKEIEQRAKKIADMPDTPLVGYRGVPAKEVAKWHDGNIERRVLVIRVSEVLSVSDSDQLPPNGWPTSIQMLRATPIEHLEQHFAPLMS